MGQVEGGQTFAAGEHAIHVYHFGGVKTRHIEGDQR